MNYKVTEACVDYAINFTLSQVEQTVIEQTKQCILDWYGCALAGSYTPEAHYIVSYINEMGGKEQATVLGHTHKNSMYNATLANGYFGHILEMDDVDKASISHPGTVVIPAVLSVAEYYKINGEKILEAIICGYEIMLRIGEAITPEHYKIWHTTATAGVFGSAIAVSKLLGLTKSEMLWALGNAGTLSSGLWQFLQNASMSKYLHAGNAASVGVKVALLAKAGFTGAEDILEGSQGFFAGYARQKIDENIFKNLGKPYKISTVSFKPYPSCRHTHSAIDSVMKLYKNYDISLDDIEKVVVHTYRQALQVAGNETASNSREAKFSMKYCVAVALYAKEVNIDSFSNEMLQNKEIRNIMSQVEVIEEEKFSAMVPGFWPCKVELLLKSGNTYVEQVKIPKGDPENKLTWEESKKKFRMLTTPYLKDAEIEKFIQYIENLGYRE